MAKAKFTSQEITSKIDSMVDASYEKYQSHSYAAGYLANMLRRVMEDLPRVKQAELMACLSQLEQKQRVDDVQI